MKKLISLILALMLAPCALAVPAMAEEALAMKLGMLTMLNMTEEEIANFNLVRVVLTAQLKKGGNATEDNPWKRSPTTRTTNGRLPHSKRFILTAWTPC